MGVSERHRWFPVTSPEKKVWDGEEAIDEDFRNSGKQGIESANIFYKDQKPEKSGRPMSKGMER